MEDFKIEELDLYELLEISINTSVNDIKKAYRKKALVCHPDKNPNNPNAAKEFHQLSKILEVLTDEVARAAYDKVLKGRKEAALRHKELDGKRRKLKEDLELREKQALNKNKINREKTASQQLQEEIERLRKEGSKQVEEEVEYVLRKLKEENANKSDWDSSKHRIKINWTAAKHDVSNGGYTQDMLHNFLTKYGDITVLVMSPKKRGSALVEFKEKRAAEMAVALEIGLPNNPLKLEWVNGPPINNHSTLVKETDFESVTLTKLRQAEERKRLIEQMMAEENDT